MNLSQVCINPAASIEQAIICIENNAKGIALVVDDDMHLLGTLTDGDIRRAILAGFNLATPVSELIAQKSNITPLYPTPVTAPLGTDRATLLRMSKELSIRHIPILDKDKKVVDLITWEDLFPDEGLPIQAIIMAGGLGTRLRPLTEDLPKPMLPVDGRPIMELMINQLREAGIRRINVTTHYKPEKIFEHFGNGEAFNVDINYVNEESPLGTAGALGLMPRPQEPVLVINGDILTQINFHAMYAFHAENEADLTMAVRQYNIQIPYGVVECTGSEVSRLTEKPQFNFLVNAGIYLLEPVVHQFIPNGCHFNMTDLIQRLLDENRKVVSFPIHEYWLDVGQLDDYERAQKQYKKERKLKF